MFNGSWGCVQVVGVNMQLCKHETCSTSSPEPLRRCTGRNRILRTRATRSHFLSGTHNNSSAVSHRHSTAASHDSQTRQQLHAVRLHPQSPRCSATSDQQASAVMNGTCGVDSIKAALLDAVKDADRGIFGMQAPDREHVLGLLAQLEALNPLAEPTQNLSRVAGDWRLLFSTITILGRKRSKLGLRDFISLGEFTQSIDTERQLAVNKVGFCVAGLGMLKGALSIEASYQTVSPTRVDITFQSASLTPKQLNALFQQNYDLLLSIFNPEGWLEITYVDEEHRIGRDDKGNVFFLERLPSSRSSTSK